MLRRHNYPGQSWPANGVFCSRRGRHRHRYPVLYVYVVDVVGGGNFSDWRLSQGDFERKPPSSGFNEASSPGPRPVRVRRDSKTRRPVAYNTPFCRSRNFKRRFIEEDSRTSTVPRNYFTRNTPFTVLYKFLTYLKFARGLAHDPNTASFHSPGRVLL